MPLCIVNLQEPNMEVIIAMYFFWVKKESLYSFYPQKVSRFSCRPVEKINTEDLSIELSSLWKLKCEDFRA